MDVGRAPLYEKLVSHFESRPASFHVPGHKSGRGVDRQAKRFFEQVMSIDLTEIAGLDDLYHAEGVIQEAQELAAHCFGAEQTFFLVNGSTVGNLAMILSLCGRDDILLVQRNAHKSVIHGLMLAGAKAVFIYPEIDKHTGLTAGISIRDVEKALAIYPEAKGLLITNPNYYGIGSHLGELAELLHAHGKPLLVDEAHGAHYGFHPELPKSALRYGADMVVQSTHKMLTSMTMGSMLHIQGKRINRAAVKNCLSLLQSSSPSYPIMASLDVARRQMHTEGYEIIEKGLIHVRWFADQMKTLPAFRVIGSMETSDKFHTKDPFKIIAADLTGTLTGFELKEQLEARGCFCEMADPVYVLLVFSLATTKDDAERLYKTFKQINANLNLDKKELIPSIPNIYNLTFHHSVSAPISFNLDMIRHNKPVRHVALEQAVGFQAAEMIIPYPPGIPVLYPGETVTPEMADYLIRLDQAGAKFQGASLGDNHTIAVFAT
jgi:arginine/lysine/ornithine decarboxylase